MFRSPRGSLWCTGLLMAWMGAGVHERCTRLVSPSQATGARQRNSVELGGRLLSGLRDSRTTV